MPEIYFSQNTILFLPQLIMSTVWVWALVSIPNPQTETKLMSAASGINMLGMLGVFGLIALVPPTPWYILNFHGGHICMLLAMIPALQWVYHMPAVDSRYRREARYVLWGSILAALILSGITALYFQRTDLRLFHSVMYLFVIFINMETFWGTYVLCRSVVHLAAIEDPAPPRADDAKRILWRLWPSSRQARYTLGFALSYFFVFLTTFSLIFGRIGLNISDRTDQIAPYFLGAYSLTFVITYVNYRPQLLTLMRKLTVLSLFVLLVLLGLAGYFIFPVLQEEYKAPPPISAMERIRFTPNLQGGYDVAQIAYQFDDDLGVGVPAEPSSEEPATLDLIFPFRFYESVWENANIYAHGLITFGEPSISVPFVEHRHPAIAPWMARLAADSGKVFINQKREQITITWQHVADLTIGEPNTFQVVLYPNGAIDFVYQELQSTLHFGSEMTDGLWLVGLLPGNGTLINQWIHYKRDLPYAGQRGQALVENVYLGFRRHVDQVLRPLAMLTIISALIILIGFPLCFRVFLIRPLNALTTGVRAVNQGDLQVRIPHYFDDELGFLTQSFNGMVDSVRSSREQLQQLNVGLEQRVAERTEQLALARDAAEEANRAKSSFLANMSHELRTPLNAILGYAQLLQNRATSQETRGAGLDTIYESGQHLLALIDNVLDLAKIEAGKVDYQPARLYLPALLQSISKIVQYQAQAKSLVYTYAADADLPDYIVGDERLLRQVLLNLLGNAIKFTQDGRVTLIVQRLTTGAGQALRFSVKDEGVGIAPEQLAKIFLPFEQAHVAQSRASGTGLGLTISQQLLTIMESRLYVKSTVGHGSTFWFDLALVEPPAATIPAGPTLRAPIIGYDGPRQQVLVADDNPANRQVLHDMLAIVGFEVLLANDGLQAHEAALAHQPCLILMDLVMPGMNGIEASAAIRKAQAQRTETSAAPPRPVIIAVSASALASDQERSLAAGCDAFLTKPIDWRQLSDLLARHLDLPWRYAAVDSQPLSTPAEASTLPPSVIIEKLYSAARMGEMSQIVKLAGDLAHTGFGDTAFVAELTALAGNYQEKAVLNLVETRLLHLKTEE